MTLYNILSEPSVVKTADLNQVFTIIKESITNDNLTEIAEVMKNPEIRRYISYLVRMQVTGGTISEEDYQNLYLIIYILQTIYTDSGEDTSVSDYDYDRLYDLLEGYGIELITTPVLSSDRIVHHRYRTLRGTLAKIYVLDDTDDYANKSRKSLGDWIRQCEAIIFEKTGRRIDLSEEEVYVFPKWDGISVTFEFDENNDLIRAITRGNTETNEAKDVTFIFVTIVSRIRDNTMDGKEYGLKTEVMVREEDKDIYNKRFRKNYKSTRSIANSIINSDSLDGRENLLEVVRLRTSQLNEDGTEKLQELASNVFDRPFIRCRLKDTDAIKKFAYSHRQIDGLNTDGAVIYIINEELRELLGRRDHKNQYEIAFKFNEDIAYTKIKDIEFHVTTFGRIFPVAVFENVVMKGNDVHDVSLGSIARFHELQLRKGDKVKILYEIIPYLVWDENDPECKRSKNPIIQAPDFCPECGERVEHNANHTILTCINPDCPCRKRGKILNYIKKVGIRDIGESTVTDLYDHGFLKKIHHIYELKDHYGAIIQLPGYDIVSVNNMINEIDTKRRIPIAVFMGAIGIECIGRKTFEKVFSVYTLEDLLEFSEDLRISKLIVISGIKELQAKKILEGIRDNRKTIDKLLAKHVEVYYPDEKKSDFIAVFHNIRSVTITNLIESMGGAVDDNLTKKTTFLIVPDGFGSTSSSTSDKARRYGVPIVEISQVPDYLKELKEKIKESE